MLSLVKKLSQIIFFMCCSLHAQPIKKDWTVLIYMAADNDLELFSRRNLAQLMNVGSNSHVNLLVQLDTKVAEGKKITKRYYIEHNKLIITNQNQQGMNSGDPQTLISAAQWACSYPSDHFMLILWNHGTGIIDSVIKDVTIPRSVNTSLLFNFNPTSQLLELDRSIPFLNYTQLNKNDPKGICYDDSTGHYLTNQKLEYALKTISHSIIRKKIDIIGFDACLMSMVEIAALIKDYAHFMVGSQEVELGTGWDYQLIFSAFSEKKLTPIDCCNLVVKSYETTYRHITPDYTQSALSLSFITTLERNIDQIAQLLILALEHQLNGSVKQSIKIASHRQFCTRFDEPSYMDIYHFYSNLMLNLKNFKFKHHFSSKKLIHELSNLLLKGQEIIQNIVVSHVAGNNLIKAQGISIYFPEHNIHSSYKKTSFALSNHWYQFITTFLS